MNKRNKEVLAILVSLSMLFNTANGKVKNDLYLPIQPLTIEEPVEKKEKEKELKKLKNM